MEITIQRLPNGLYMCQITGNPAISNTTSWYADEVDAYIAIMAYDHDSSNAKINLPSKIKDIREKAQKRLGG